MRRPRVKVPPGHGQAYYHCVSRVVGREFLLGEAEKEQFVRYMRLYEKLYGLRVISYAVMSNHFHILVEVPQRPEDSELPDDAGLVAHVRSCLGDEAATELEWELSHYRGQGNDKSAEELRERWFSRMWDISRYMKVLKQRFTQWFNGRHNRRGTLWEDRFRSVLVEGKGAAIKTMAAYIDLNPVRAGICQDPKDYRWCSYGEAVAGGQLAQKALQWLQSFRVDSLGGVEHPAGPDAAAVSPAPVVPNKEALERWRCYLFGVPYSEKARTEVQCHSGQSTCSAIRVSPCHSGQSTHPNILLGSPFNFHHSPSNGPWRWRKVHLLRRCQPPSLLKMAQRRLREPRVESSRLGPHGKPFPPAFGNSRSQPRFGYEASAWSLCASLEPEASTPWTCFPGTLQGDPCFR
ncbi:hypothetical protein GCM10007100_00600 [Roseibacillus persicicus]|uniref:Transposase IS200-like domain-containing protein n=1 Tax=Roseibacillus persicicus TaxID=454148 RepID=A0A918TC83_9BACT|nr:transposase [Roseibacillus persicicus]GHC40148.1 hypothetical protein GCM10007100_00600 [Roseibacillus persicicus]